MTTYQYLIFDVDDTLLDFHAAFKSAQKNIAALLDIEPSNDYMEADEKCGWRAWEESGLGNTDQQDVQEHYHEYYKQYIRKHFEYLLDMYGKANEARELEEVYIKSIAMSKVLKEQDTLDVFAQLSEKYTLVLATNGLERIQKERLSDFLPFTHRLYISEKISLIKPTNAFYRYILSDLNCKADQCLMIGDSIANDIIGAKAIGMNVCYYNASDKKVPDDVLIDYEIRSIHDLVRILL